MKKFLLFVFVLASIMCYAEDELVFHNGKVAKGKVTEVTDICVKFKYTGEDVINIIGKNALAEVRFESGRVEQMSQKIEIKDPKKDWEKVRVVTDKNEVMGLKTLGQVEKHASGTWSFSVTAGHFSEKTLKKVRQEAANRGGCIVLIIDQKSKSAGFFSDGHASMSGEIYGY